MRGWSLLLMPVVLVSTVRAAEPPAKYTATVTMSAIEMRAGASLKFPQTGKLKKGEQVAIHHEEDQWYAILPPPGSVSWVNHLFLGKFDPNLQVKQNAVIMKDHVPVRVGTEVELQNEGKDHPPILPVSKVKLMQGSQVELIGPKKRFEDSTWYPITPPVGEFRYIPKFAVGNLQNVQTPVSVAKTNPGGSGSQNPIEAVPIAQPGKVNHPLWAEAELLQSQERYADAEKVYIQIYQELKAKKAELDELLTCLNRIDDCKQKGRLNTNFTPPRDGGFRPPASLDAPSGLRPASPPPPVRRDWPTSRIDDKADSPASGGDAALKATSPGFLRRTPFFIDNKQAYALEKERGEVLYYVTAQSGVNLENHLNKRVELLGTPQVRGDVRGAPYMVVSKVNALTK